MVFNDSTIGETYSKSDGNQIDDQVDTDKFDFGFKHGIESSEDRFNEIPCACILF